MATVSITISDALAAKITTHFGDMSAWQVWIKDKTRRVLREAQIRAAQEAANADYAKAVEAIIAADKDMS